MNAILKFDFKNKKTITFFRRKLSKLNKRKQTNKKTNKQTNNLACDINIFPKTRGNKNKQWTHLFALKKKEKYCE